MPLVSKSASLACRAERLTRAGARPGTTVVGPVSGSQGGAPNTNSSEEMTLRVANEIGRSDVENASFVNISVCNVSFDDEVAKPHGRKRVDLIVVSFH